MLVLIILVRLSKPHRRNPTFEKWNVITSAAITISAIDHQDFHRRHVTLAGFFDKPRQLPRSRIILAANAATRGGFSLRFVRRNAFGKDSDRMRIAHAVAAKRAANAVIGSH